MSEVREEFVVAGGRRRSCSVDEGLALREGVVKLRRKKTKNSNGALVYEEVIRKFSKSLK